MYVCMHEYKFCECNPKPWICTMMQIQRVSLLEHEHVHLRKHKYTIGSQHYQQCSHDPSISSQLFTRLYARTHKHAQTQTSTRTHTPCCWIQARSRRWHLSCMLPARPWWQLRQYQQPQLSSAAAVSAHMHIAARLRVCVRARFAAPTCPCGHVQMWI